MNILLLFLFKLFLADCPAKDKCPHYDQNTHKDLPTNSDYKNCPHFDEIKGCPMKDCPHKNNFKESDFAGCPIKEKCPHFKSKCTGENCNNGDESSCELGPDCPHLKSMREKEKEKGCPFANEKCPYMDSDHDECPLEKCPMYERLKAGKLTKSDLDGKDCPLKDKCPYYKKFKNDPTVAQDCPMVNKGQACPHAHSHKMERIAKVGGVKVGDEDSEIKFEDGSDAGDAGDSQDWGTEL